jgi:Soluble lytic murein transglycosylase and related regulatory proteins (some contain LysM/invasin domains)
MKKFLAAMVLLIALGGGATALFWLTAEDPEYRLQELVFRNRYRRYDDLILQASARYGVPPELIKAVIWRESRFHPDKTGQHGERGLMQITEGAAADWARVEKIETFVPTDLFDPKVNIEAGAWYLKKALDHWASKDDPVPFALAEYNAGRTRVKRWVNDSGRGETAGASDLRTAMDFPATKSYIASITARQQFYKRRGEFPDSPNP